MDIRSLMLAFHSRGFWKARRHVAALAGLGALLACCAFGPVDRLAFDLTSVLSFSKPPLDVGLVEISRATRKALNQPLDGSMDRHLYAKALRRLKHLGVKVVVFDQTFEDESDKSADNDFGQAIREHGKVVLAVELSPIQGAGHDGWQVIPPISVLADGATIGACEFNYDPDRYVRRHQTNLDLAPGLGAQAVTLLGLNAPIDYQTNGVSPPDRYLRWYPPWAFRHIAFESLIDGSHITISQKV